jgi:hypothetical protein
VGAKALERILKLLRVVEKPQHGKPKHLGQTVRRAYKFEFVGRQRCLVVPRTWATLLRNNRLLTSVRKENLLPEPRRIREEACEFAIDLYNYQTAAANYICEHHFSEAKAAAQSAVAYLQMDTGLGKTRVALGTAVRLRVPTLIVVPTLGIAFQWIEEISEVLPGATAGIYVNAKKQKPGPATHDFVLVIVNTLAKKDASFMEGYGLAVFDECHELQSPKHGGVLWMPAKYALGLSATPFDRPDGLDVIVTKHLGNVIFQNTIPGFDISEASFSGETWCIEYEGNPLHCENGVSTAGTMMAVKTIGSVNGDPSRLRLIAEKVEQLYKMHEGPLAAKYGLGVRPDDPAGTAPRRHGVFVFAEHREQLPAIRRALLEKLKESEIDSPELSEHKSVVLRGGVASADLAEAKKVRVVLSTYGYGRRGLSLKDMTCIVLASPRRNGLRQILGRARRRGSDQSIVRIVVDVVDVCTGLKSQFNDRKKVYKSMNYPIKVSQVSYDQIELGAGAAAAAPWDGEKLDEGGLADLDALLSGGQDSKIVDDFFEGID